MACPEGSHSISKPVHSVEPQAGKNLVDRVDRSASTPRLLASYVVHAFFFRPLIFILFPMATFPSVTLLM